MQGIGSPTVAPNVGMPMAATTRHGNTAIGNVCVVGIADQIIGMRGNMQLKLHWDALTMPSQPHTLSRVASWRCQDCVWIVSGIQTVQTIQDRPSNLQAGPSRPGPRYYQAAAARGFTAAYVQISTMNPTYLHASRQSRQISPQVASCA